ncbi:hypothetical protein [Mariniflexile sp. HMF6888]|uniref:hypothetical protein n=1 Tax=Mariniflexile sp. HMF6888 TaxID=3373086 RepID=UPI0037AD6669
MFQGKLQTVTLRRPFDFNKWVDNLTDNRVNIIKAIHKNYKVSKRELEEIVGLSPIAIDNNLDALKNIALIERVGGAKGDHLKILVAMSSFLSKKLDI